MSYSFAVYIPPLFSADYESAVIKRKRDAALYQDSCIGERESFIFFVSTDWYVNRLTQSYQHILKTSTT